MKNGSAACGRRILVLHDLQETREAIESFLRKDGYLVYGAADADSAIDRARQHHPDLILVSLAGAPQRVLSESLRVRSQAGLGRQIPIVVLFITTAEEGSELQIGEMLYIALPDNLNQLRALLARLLERTSNPD